MNRVIVIPTGIRIGEASRLGDCHAVRALDSRVVSFAFSVPKTITRFAFSVPIGCFRSPFPFRKWGLTSRK